jgi:putative membrane protein
MGAVSWGGIYLAVLVWSAIEPKDFFIWLLEVFPALIAAGVLLVTRRRFPLTPLLYVLILIHCLILMQGGHYTYAEEPFFNWLKEVFGWPRNNYDKLGHFAQGFVPAMVAREILLRKSVVSGRGWLNFLVVCVALAISAFYELLEWWVAVLSGTAADAFLATQGYVWDTQSDMGFALLGAIAALLLFTKMHDRQLAALRRLDREVSLPVPA